MSKARMHMDCSATQCLVGDPDWCPPLGGRTEPTIGPPDALTAAVARAEAALDREVWIAVRITDKGDVAFMGAFDSLENAQKRCEYRKDPAPFWWRARSDHPDVHEWETDWFPWFSDVRVKFAVALRQVQDHPFPRTISEDDL